VKIKVNYIGFERDDSISIVNNKLLYGLRDKVNFNIILFKTKIETIFLRYLIHIMDLIKLFKILFKKEIIHFECPGGIEPILIIFINNKKTILTVHHLEERKCLLDLSFFIMRLKHNAFSRLIAVSEKTKKDLIEKYKINPNKIEVAYLGVDRKLFKNNSKKVDLLKNKRYLLYLGSEVPRKNIENLLKAFKEISMKYPNLYLVKAGYSGGDKYRENTLKLIKDLKLKDKVIIISKRLREEELPKYSLKCSIQHFL
jgi:glycosyltransferase involved in cell wall biosynthesis